MLDSVVTDLASAALRARALATVAGDLLIARRNWSAYPSGHPQTEAAVQKLLVSWEQLLQGGANLHLGVTREGLLLDGEFVEKDNRICKNLAALLFERGIGSLLLLNLPQRDELTALLGLLGQKREDIFARGGIEQLWQEAGIVSLQVRGIRYDRFSGTEQTGLDDASAACDDTKETGSIWERFVRLLLQGEVGLAGTDAGGNLRPEVLAASLNAHFARRLGVGSGLSSGTLKGVGEVMEQLFSRQEDAAAVEGTGGAPGTGEGSDWSELADSRPEIRADLRAFIAALDPGLRRQILNGFCETGAGDQETVGELFRYLGPTLLQDTYATAEEYAGTPPLLQAVLRKLLPQLTESYETSSTDTTVRERMQTLLQEHQVEAYMPESYLQGLLQAMQSGAVKPLVSAELSGMLQTVSPAFIDSRGSEIILQLVVADPTGESARELITNLAEMCGHFLELGDYGQVLKILHQAADPRLPQPLRLAMRDAFCRREFLDEILSGLSIWGKSKYDQVTLLIQVLGRAFIEPLLDRMAEEENMSLRRYMMDRVQSFGDAARPCLLQRLTDPRWFVLRNIILMLRTVARPDDVEKLRPLLKHSNQKVRVESLKLLLLLGDPVAQRQVLRDIDSPDRETQLLAISLADSASPPEMARKLLGLVNSGGFSQVECELKSAAVQALGEIGRPELLPELAGVLGSRSLLNFKALNRLKLDIVRSFEKYPPAAAGPVLERLASGSDDLARQAAESLKNLQSRITP